METLLNTSMPYTDPEWLEELVNQLPGMVYQCRLDDYWTMEFVSAGCFELTGYLPSDLIHNQTIAYADIILPEDRNKVRRQVDKAISEQNPFQITYRVRTKRGKTIWVRERGRGIWSDKGTLLYLEGFVGDITDQQTLQQKLRVYERIVHHMPLGLIVYQLEDLKDDQTLKLIAANPAAEQLTEVPLNSKPNRSILEVFPDLSKKGIPQLFAEVIRKNQPMEIDEFAYGDLQVPEKVWALKAFPLPEAQVGVAFEDVSDRVNKKNALDQAVALLSSTLESTNDGILVVSAEGSIEAFNARFVEMWSIPESVIASRSEKQLWEYASDQLKSPQTFNAKLKELYPRPELEKNDILEFTDGRTFEWASRPRKNQGESLGRVWTFHDVTHRAAMERTIQRQLSHLKALQAIDRAISGSTDLSVTLEVFLDQVTTQLKVDAAAVLLVNKASQELEYVAGRGFWTPLIEDTKQRVGAGVSGRAVLLQQPVTILDFNADSDFQRTNLIEEEEVVFYCGVPLIAKGETKGLLEIFGRQPYDPTEEWMNFATTLAGQGAIAVDSGELFENLRSSNVELTLAYDSTIEALARALDLRNEDTADHSRRVTDITLEVARAMGIASDQLPHIRRGALLHDVGKIGIADAILLKPGKLTDEEWVVMKEHTTRGYELLAPIPFLRPALDIPYCHHEKWDGSGYPRGLTGETIPIAARIFSVVDVWDALTSDRPYRERWPREKVRTHLRELAGSHFDPQVVEMFLKIIDH